MPPVGFPIARRPFNSTKLRASKALGVLAKSAYWKLGGLRKTKMASTPKKRRIKPDRDDHQTKALADMATIPSQDYLRSDVNVVKIDLNIQVAKKHAVSQAHIEGCLGNFRSFDSPFGNYLVPVIPTKADLLRNRIRPKANKNVPRYLVIVYYG